jgi:hypothetical protein
MKNKNIITIAAVAIAGIATYVVRKVLTDRRREKSEPASGSGRRHITDVFAKAKSAAGGQTATP